MSSRLVPAQSNALITFTRQTGGFSCHAAAAKSPVPAAAFHPARFIFGHGLLVRKKSSSSANRLQPSRLRSIICTDHFWDRRERHTAPARSGISYLERASERLLPTWPKSWLVDVEAFLARFEPIKISLSAWTAFWRVTERSYFIPPLAAIFQKLIPSFICLLIWM